MLDLMPSSKEELKDWLRENLRLDVRVKPVVGAAGHGLFVALKFKGDGDTMIDWRIVELPQ